MVEPIGPQYQRLVSEHTQFYIDQGERIFGCDFKRIPVQFDLRGSTAGMFKVTGRHCVIRYNPWIFSKYFDENLRDTVPHEVAHYLVYAVYGDRRIKPHGSQWREVMERFGADPGVTFDLDLAGVPQRKQRTHPYRCDCRMHELSTTRHNRIQHGRGSYQCIQCSSELTYAPESM